MIRKQKDPAVESSPGLPSGGSDSIVSRSKSLYQNVVAWCSCGRPIFAGDFVQTLCRSCELRNRVMYWGR